MSPIVAGITGVGKAASVGRLERIRLLWIADSPLCQKRMGFRLCLETRF
jgi:hypothetical protein